MVKKHNQCNPVQANVARDCSQAQAKDVSGQTVNEEYTYAQLVNGLKSLKLGA